MILRIDRLAIELPAPSHPSPNSASAVQELLGGDGAPEGAPVPLHPEEPQLTSPIGPDGLDQGMLTEVAARLFGKSGTRS